MLIPDFYVRSNGDIICIPSEVMRDDEPAFRDIRAFKCNLVNTTTLLGVPSHYSAVITTVMNGQPISQTTAKNNDVVRYTSPIYKEVSSPTSLTIFQQDNKPNEIRTQIHLELNKPENLVKSITGIELSSEKDILDFLIAQNLERCAFIPDGSVIRIPIREILKLYAATLPAIIIMPRVFYFYDRDGTSKRYITLPSFIYTRQIEQRLGVLFQGPESISSLPRLSLSDNNSETISGKPEILIIGAAVFLFIALVLGFSLLYWFYMTDSY